jgi:hypothetical protein
MCVYHSKSRKLIGGLQKINYENKCHALVSERNREIITENATKIFAKDALYHKILIIWMTRIEYLVDE